MKPYQEMTKEELQAEQAQLTQTYSQLQAKRLGIRMTPEDIENFSLRAFLHDAPIFVLPLLAIIALLVMGYPAPDAAPCPAHGQRKELDEVVFYNEF